MYIVHSLHVSCFNILRLNIVFFSQNAVKTNIDRAVSSKKVSENYTKNLGFC